MPHACEGGPGSPGARRPINRGSQSSRIRGRSYSGHPRSIRRCRVNPNPGVCTQKWCSGVANSEPHRVPKQNLQLRRWGVARRQDLSRMHVDFDLKAQWVPRKDRSTFCLRPAGGARSGSQSHLLRRCAPRTISRVAIRQRNNFCAGIGANPFRHGEALAFRRSVQTDGCGPFGKNPSSSIPGSMTVTLRPTNWIGGCAWRLSCAREAASRTNNGR